MEKRGKEGLEKWLSKFIGNRGEEGPKEPVGVRGQGELPLGVEEEMLPPTEAEEFLPPQVGLEQEFAPEFDETVENEMVMAEDIPKIGEEDLYNDLDFEEDVENGQDEYVDWAMEDSAGSGEDYIEPMTKDRLDEGKRKFQEYKSAKAKLDVRLVDNNKWWEIRHWETMPQDGKELYQKSAWLLNSLLGKHADAMDNYPQANILPREDSDKDTARTLTSVLPAILEYNEFEKVYSDAWWDKLKSGTAVYGIYWNQDKNGGLGDVEIANVDLLGLFWEPGIKDIQKSEHVFHCAMVNNDRLEEMYPHLKGKLTGGNTYGLRRYNEDGWNKDFEKTTVIDWYYKVNDIVHYCKFCGDEVLYCSQEDPAYSEKGFYEDGKYPFVFDVMFPVEGSPAGFGYVDTMKDVQERIDKVGTGITRNAVLRSKQRFWVKDGAGVNQEEFADFDKDFVHISANQIGEAVGQIQVDPIGGDVTGIYTHWIEELKETSGNRDVSQGGTQSGVTAASAIAALQEAASKLTRDMLKTSYRNFQQLCYMVIERVRQFYDNPRTFRIIGEGGEDEYTTFDQGMLGVETEDLFGMISQRKPIFDIKVAPQKSSPYTKMAQNELAFSFYDRGFFNPQNTDQALSCLEMMDFDGKEKLMGQIQQNGSLAQQVQELQQSCMQLSQLVEQLQPGMGVMDNTAAMVGGGAPQGLEAMMGGMGGGNPMMAALGAKGTGNPVGNSAKGKQGFMDTDSLGEERSATDMAARTRKKVAKYSDPNGGQP